jgi:hypothetical protein
LKKPQQFKSNNLIVFDNNPSILIDSKKQSIDHKRRDCCLLDWNNRMPYEINGKFKPPTVKKHHVNGILLEIPPGSTYPDWYPMYYGTLIRGVGNYELRPAPRLPGSPSSQL